MFQDKRALTEFANYNNSLSKRKYIEKDLSNQIVGNFTVLRRSEERKRYWVCRCVCGVEKEIFSSNIHKTKSCGCLSKKQETI